MIHTTISLPEWAEAMKPPIGPDNPRCLTCGERGGGRHEWFSPSMCARCWFLRRSGEVEVEKKIVAPKPKIPPHLDTEIRNATRVGDPISEYQKAREEWWERQAQKIRNVPASGPFACPSPPVPDHQFTSRDIHPDDTSETDTPDFGDAGDEDPCPAP